MGNGLRCIFLLLLTVFITSCGYHNPNIYSGPHKTIYVKKWQNRTSQLGLDSDLYRSLTEWFQNSSALSIVGEKNGADLILAGEIISITLPSLAYNSSTVASEVKVRLQVRYILKEISTNKILLEVPNQIWSEEYIVNPSSSANIKNEEKALETIVNDISKRIYQRTVAILPKL